MRYYGFAYQDSDNPSFWLTEFPDFEKAFTQGTSLTEAMEMGREVLGFAIDDYQDRGLALPEPSTPDAVIAKALADEGYKESHLTPPIIYTVNIPNRDPRPARVNISLTHGQLADIDARAKELGLTRSALMVKGALAYGE